jgi:O-antigen/teichoic acid export membrane protein
MGVIRKQSTIISVLLYLGIVIGFVGIALIRPKLLSESEIGFLQVILNTTGLFAGIFTLGSSFIVLRLYPKFKTADGTNRGLLTLIVLIGLAGTLLMIPTFLCTEFFFFESQDGSRLIGFEYNYYFYLGLIFMVINRLFQVVFDTYLRANHQSVLGIFSESVILKIFPIIGLVLFFVGWIDFRGLIFYSMWIYLIPVLLSLLFLYRMGLLRFHRPDGFSLSERKEIIGASGVGFFEIVSAGIILYVDTIMVQWYLGKAEVGIYTTLFFFGLAIGIPAKALTRVGIVHIAEAFAEQNMGKIQEIYRKSSEVLTVVGGYLFLVVWCNRYSVETYLGDAYSPYSAIIFFIGLAQVVELASSVNYQIIAVSNYYYINIVFALLSIFLLVVTNYYGIQWYGLVGASIGSLVTMVVVNLIRFFFLRSRFQLNPFSSRTLRTLLVFAGTFAVVELTPNYPDFILNFLLKASMISMLYLPLVYVLNCSEDLNVVVNKYRKKLGI